MNLFSIYYSMAFVYLNNILHDQKVPFETVQCTVLCKYLICCFKCDRYDNNPTNKEKFIKLFTHLNQGNCPGKTHLMWF